MYEKVDFWQCLNALRSYWWNWLADCKYIYRSGWSMVNGSECIGKQQVTDNCINIFPSSCSVIKGWIYVVNGR